MLEFQRRPLCSPFDTEAGRSRKLLDDELEAWRRRPLGEIKYLIIYARYEMMRYGGIVRDVAVLLAIGIGRDERRRVPGISVALLEAEVHWRSFLESLVARGMRGVEFIVSDDHARLRAACRAVFGGATWQRGQFHLAQNAIHPAPNAEIRQRIGAGLRGVWNASTLDKANNALADIAAQPPSWPTGSNRTCLRVSLCLLCPKIIVADCVPQTRSNGPSSRSSNAAPSKSGSSQAKMPSCASPPLSSPKSTKISLPKPGPVSIDNARMAELPRSEFPDIRLNNRMRGRLPPRGKALNCSVRSRESCVLR